MDISLSFNKVKKRIAISAILEDINLVIPLNIIQGFLKFMASSKAATENLLKALNINKGAVQIKELDKKAEIDLEKIKAKTFIHNVIIRIPEKVLLY